MIQENQFTHFRKTAADRKRSGKYLTFLSQLTNTYPYPVICLDRRGRIIYGNDASREFNYSEISQGKKIGDILPPHTDIAELIDRKRSVEFSLAVSGRIYSVILKGDPVLKQAFLYFRDACRIRELKEELEETNHKLKKYSSRLHEVLEDEKQKLACELHDTIGQNLVSIRIKLQRYRELFNFYNSAIEYQDILNLLEYSFKQIKHISYSLKPRILDEMGLGPALTSFCHSISDETGIKGSIDIIKSYKTAAEPEEHLDHKLEAHLYRITQETVHNRLNNSNLSEFNIQLIDAPGSVKIFFTDNGTSLAERPMGLTSEFTPYNISLDFIKDKVESMEGNMKMDLSSDNGALIIVEIPKKAS